MPYYCMLLSNSLCSIQSSNSSRRILTRLPTFITVNFPLSAHLLIMLLLTFQEFLKTLFCDPFLFCNHNEFKKMTILWIIKNCIYCTSSYSKQLFQHEISRGLIYIISLFFEIEQHHSSNSNRLKIPDYSHSARNTSFP